ncbi:MAG: DUF983 domain-containing protein [Alphaproteobacteria bacterium]|nr:MAG: DUF983 domain-containing protein [Alphaproteobacteria bacterium]
MRHEVVDTNLAGERELKPALLRGFRRRCPNCGAGPMFKGYLTVRRSCPSCGEELHHHRADDGPAWATILVSGHLIAPAMLIVYSNWSPEPWVVAVSFSLVFLVIALYLLPRIKGLMVAFQWARRMHGFGGEEG